MTVQKAAPLTLSARGVAVWRGDRCLCNDLSFELHSGQVLHIQGPNGSGKTSLMRVLAGIGRCDAGEVLWQGESVRHSGAGYRAALAYVGHSNGVKLGLNPRENLAAAGVLMGVRTEVATDDALTQVGLSAAADVPCGLLSIGQRRRTALARLLLTHIPLWFLDEPLANLDVTGVALVSRMLKEHLTGGGMAVIATHQPLELTPFPVQTLRLGAPL